MVPGLDYTVVSSDPPQVQITTVSDRTDLDPNHNGTLRFDKWELVLGRSAWRSEAPRKFIVPGYPFPFISGSGLILSDSHMYGSVPRNGLEMAFDFYDHGGNVSLPYTYTGFHDLVSGSAFLIPCHGVCEWNAGRGAVLAAYGADMTDLGYGANLSTMKHETPQTAAIEATKGFATAGLTPQDAPPAMQGNGTFTVAGIFRINGPGNNLVPLWSTGTDNGSLSSMVALAYYNPTEGPLELTWGLGSYRWRFKSGFSPTRGNWYFIACTVQANGAAPIVHMWTGVGGVVTDKLAGVARTLTGGSPTQIPAVAAGPFVLNTVNNTSTARASYAGLYVYSRALGLAEAGLLYSTLKADMTRRGVTLQ